MPINGPLNAHHFILLSLNSLLIARSLPKVFTSLIISCISVFTWPSNVIYLTIVRSLRAVLQHACIIISGHRSTSALKNIILQPFSLSLFLLFFLRPQLHVDRWPERFIVPRTIALSLPQLSRGISVSCNLFSYSQVTAHMTKAQAEKLFSRWQEKKSKFVFLPTWQTYKKYRRISHLHEG